MELSTFADFSLSLVALSAFIPGLVQTVKELLGWDGNKARALTVFTGMFFGGLFYAVDQQLIPAVAHPWIKLAVFTLMSGPAAMGYYSLLFKPIQAFAEPLNPDARYGLTDEGRAYLDWLTSQYDD